jgi:hypothetical protein
MHLQILYTILVAKKFVWDRSRGLATRGGGGGECVGVPRGSVEGRQTGDKMDILHDKGRFSAFNKF